MPFSRTNFAIAACTIIKANGSTTSTQTETENTSNNYNDTGSGLSGSRLRTVNIAVGCPEFQIAFNSAIPGSIRPFRSFTLTKETTYSYVMLHFSKLWMPRGSSVVFRAVEGFDAEDILLNLSINYLSGYKYDDISTPPVLSKEFRVEFYRHEGSRNTIETELSVEDFNITDSNSNCFGFVVNSYYYMPVDDENPLVGTSASVCAVDNTKRAICYYEDLTTRTAYLAARSVARLFISKGQNVFESCTGWLLGNQGHLMTNYHCVSSDTEATSTTVEFMVENNKCNGTASCTWKECKGNMVSITTKLVHVNKALDYALLQFPSNGAQIAQIYGYLRFKTRAGVVGELLYIPQHPLGNSKRIAIVDDYNSNISLLSLSASSCGISGYSYSGDTQSGSSGSPVLSYSDHGVLALHHCGDLCANIGIPAKSIVEDLKANGINLATFDGIDDDSDPAANGQNFPSFTPTKAVEALPLTTRLNLNGVITFTDGYVSIDNVEFTLKSDTEVTFDVFSVEIADNNTFVDLNGDCQASYLDSIIYLFPYGYSSLVFVADDNSIDATVKNGSVSFRDPYKRTFLKKGSYILAIASTESSEDDARTGKLKPEYPPELYSCRSRGLYGSYRLEISSTVGLNPFQFTNLPPSFAITGKPNLCQKPPESIC